MANTTLSCPIPSNINPLSPNGFMFAVQKLPTLTFFCQQVNLPSITLGAAEFNNPLSTAPVPGEILTYDQLTVQFLVDESMENYRAIYNWMIGLGFPETHEQYASYITNDDRLVTSELAKNYSDGTLSILGSNNTPVKAFQFVDMFPISLESLVFQSTNQDVQYLVGSATFRYHYYKIL